MVASPAVTEGDRHSYGLRVLVNRDLFRLAEKFDEVLFDVQFLHKDAEQPRRPRQPSRRRRDVIEKLPAFGPMPPKGHRPLSVALFFGSPVSGRPWLM